ncbi:MAG TPA: hypothetical protein VFA03_03715 [Acetobacteraceae bacterium]|nr:hypothetical protein [Acetobacteraceae bacterium]
MTHDPPHPLALDDPWALRPAPSPGAAQEELLFAPCGPASLQEAIDLPGRSLAIEYKSWRNLRNPEDQAELAADIAALANLGGGAIIFGFNEETLAPADLHPIRTAPDRAALDSILRVFLDPPPVCEILSLRAAQGEDCTVIRVGAHGATPVFIRAHGLPPAALAAIRPGAVYVRRHAPPRRGQLMPRVESAPVSSPAEFLPLIRRCVRADREALLGAIEAAVEGRREAPDEAARLAAFHDAARARFLSQAARLAAGRRFAERHHAFSYALELGRAELLEPAQMPELLSRTALTVGQSFRAGARMFDPPYLRTARPRFVTDPALGEDEPDFLEASWMREPSRTERAELWRVSARGAASIVRPFWEDEQDAANGPWLSPNRLARDLAELALHARTLARPFGSVRAVLFRCEWIGLAGRRLDDPWTRWAQSESAIADRRTVALRVPVASLAREWPETVAQLMAPVVRLIEPDLVLGPDWVRAEAASWTEPLPI